MCFTMAIFSSPEKLEKRFNATFPTPSSFTQNPVVSGFDHKRSPVITANDPGHFQFFHWGLIPAWVKEKERAKEMMNRTLNARAETVFEKASFREAIRQRRCIVPCDGFYEWRHINGKKIPYFIRLPKERPMALAGIWEAWHFADKTYRTFSILTTEANPLMAKIHNTKQRMPVILPTENEKTWLDPTLDQTRISEISVPYTKKLDAFTVRGPKRGEPAKQALQPYDYPELANERGEGQGELF
ncbi:DUF159 family protein (plasmid) [Fulvitalea axinellae]|uniref:Abasic site processing protein n=1 Tax=Fulvitalea axinellae TaxID=1182444 RepID=A0AAU9CRP8_9BACT|nr:DUF159 family protein [Fulvitalea axinellae]